MDPISIAMTLAPYAPAVVRWLSGSDKAEQAAEQVVQVAQAITGRDDAAQAVEAIKADPALALQFRQAIALNEREWDALYLQDRQGARGRDVEFVRAGRQNWRADVLAVLAVGGLVACVWFVARDAALPERAVNAIMFVAGVLAAAVRDVYGFEFGSSRGSREKDAMLAKERQS